MTVDEARERRRKAERFGHLAEHAAAWLLRFKGYRIIARRERTPHGEIDLIAVRGRVSTATRLGSMVETSANIPGRSSSSGLSTVARIRTLRLPV